MVPEKKEEVQMNAVRVERANEADPRRWSRPRRVQRLLGVAGANTAAPLPFLLFSSSSSR